MRKTTLLTAVALTYGLSVSLAQPQGKIDINKTFQKARAGL